MRWCAQVILLVGFVLLVSCAAARRLNRVQPAQQAPADKIQLPVNGEAGFEVRSVSGNGVYVRRFDITPSVPVDEIELVQVMPLAPRDMYPYLIKPNELSKGFEFDYGSPQVVIPKIEVKLKTGKSIFFEKRIRVCDELSTPRSRILSFGRGEAYGDPAGTMDFYPGEPLRLVYLPEATAEETLEYYRKYYPPDYGSSPRIYKMVYDDPLIEVRIEDYPDHYVPLPPTAFDTQRFDVDISRDGREVVFNHILHKRRLPVGLDWFWAMIFEKYGSRAMAFYTSDLYVVETDGDGLRRITNSETVKERPNFNPDGTEILYTEENPLTGRRQLKILDLAKLNVFTLTDGSYDDFGGVFSPDGKEIIYSSNDGRSVRLKVISRTGEHLRTYEIPVDAYDPCYSPDGEKIAFVGPNKEYIPWLGYPDIDDPVIALYIMNRDGSGLMAVPEKWYYYRGGRFPQNAVKPEFSPDGSSLYFIGLVPYVLVTRPFEPHISGDVGLVFVYDLKEERIHQVTAPPIDPQGSDWLNHTSPSWLVLGQLAFAVSPVHVSD